MGYAHLAGNGEAETVVDPDRPALQHELLEWVLRRAAERGVGRLEHWSGPRADGLGATALRAHGFAQVRTVWQMVRPTSLPVPPTALPDGVTLRPFDRERDGREVHAVVMTAFAGTFGSHPRPYEEWAHLVLDAGADVLCAEQDGRLVAVATHFVRLGDGTVGQLGVDPAHRGRGTALALLHETFRRDARAGRPRTVLSVDGENAGARRLYEKAGMHPEEEFHRWERDV